MEIEYYITVGGKNLILDYIDRLPKKEVLLDMILLKICQTMGLKY